MSRPYHWFCKICGAPRYTDCDLAFCEEHYLVYLRAKVKVTCRRKKRGELNLKTGKPYGVNS